MGTVDGKVVTYRDGLPPIKSHDHLNKRSFEVTWEIKYITSPIAEALWAPN